MNKKTMLTLAAAFMMAFSVTATANNGDNLPENNPTVETALINLENDYVQLRMVKSPEAVVKVKITAQNGTVAYKDTFKKRNQVAVKYNLGDLNPGHYTVNIEQDGKVIQSYPVSTRVTSMCPGN